MADERYTIDIYTNAEALAEAVASFHVIVQRGLGLMPPRLRQRPAIQELETVVDGMRYTDQPLRLLGRLAAALTRAGRENVIVDDLRHAAISGAWSDADRGE
jgi:hypothetical protein